MRRRVILAAFALLLGVGAYGVYGGLGPGQGSPAAVPAAVVERGRATGSFDPRMSGVCRFSCAAPQAREAQDVVLQPGVADGALTQCPVSGVIFVVDPQRPRVALATGEYVLCCDGCEGRFRKNPGRFVNL